MKDHAETPRTEEGAYMQEGNTEIKVDRQILPSRSEAEEYSQHCLIFSNHAVNPGNPEKIFDNTSSLSG